MKVECHYGWAVARPEQHATIIIEPQSRWHRIVTAYQDWVFDSMLGSFIYGLVLPLMTTIMCFCGALFIIERVL